MKRHHTKLHEKNIVLHPYNNFLARPSRLGQMIPDKYNDIVVIDEVQRAPALLHEVHRLIEERNLIFALTGSSARLNDSMFKGLKKFLAEYPMARAFLVYGGDRTQWEGNIRVIPIFDFLKNLEKILGERL